MARIGLGHLAVAGSRALGGLARGRFQGTLLAGENAERRHRTSNEDLRLMLALESRQQNTRDRSGLMDFLSNEPEGKGLSGLDPTDALSVYSSRRADRRSQTPSPSETRVSTAAQHDEIYKQAEALADYQASLPTPWKPNSLAAYLAARFPALNFDRLSGIATRALRDAQRAKTAGGPIDVQSLLQHLPK